MNKNNSFSFWLALSCFALLGGGVVYWMSGPFGLGLTTDSICYIQGAKHWLLGQGVSSYNDSAKLTAMGWYPPGYPVVLSAAWYLGFSFFEWARLLNSFFFASTMMMVGALVYYVTGLRWAAFMGVLLLASQVHTLEVHGKLLSEPLFLNLLMLCVCSLVYFVNTNNRVTLYMAALTAGLAAVVRYSGLPLIVAATVWLWFCAKKDNKLQDPLRFAVVASVFPIVLFVRNTILGCATQGSVPDFFSQGYLQAYYLLQALSEWLLPSSTMESARIVFFGAVLSMLALWVGAYWKSLQRHVRRPAGLLLGFAVLYFFSSGWVMFFTKTNFFLNHRLLTPVYLVVLAAFAVLLPDILRSVRFDKRIFWLCLAVLIAVGAARSIQVAMVLRKNGFGYSSKKVSTSKLAETLRSIDDRVPLYSNDIEAVYYFAGRPAVKIPQKAAQAAYSMSAAGADFKDRRGVAIIFDDDLYASSEGWHALRSSLGLQLLFRDSVGCIYGIKKK